MLCVPPPPIRAVVARRVGHVCVARRRHLHHQVRKPMLSRPASRCMIIAACGDARRWCSSRNIQPPSSPSSLDDLTPFFRELFQLAEMEGRAEWSYDQHYAQHCQHCLYPEDDASSSSSLRWSSFTTSPGRLPGSAAPQIDFGSGRRFASHYIPNMDATSPHLNDHSASELLGDVEDPTTTTTTTTTTLGEPPFTSVNRTLTAAMQLPPLLLRCARSALGSPTSTDEEVRACARSPAFIRSTLEQALLAILSSHNNNNNIAPRVQHLYTIRYETFPLRDRQALEQNLRCVWSSSALGLHVVLERLWRSPAPPMLPLELFALWRLLHPNQLLFTTPTRDDHHHVVMDGEEARMKADMILRHVNHLTPAQAAEAREVGGFLGPAAWLADDAREWAATTMRASSPAWAVVCPLLPRVVYLATTLASTSSSSSREEVQQGRRAQEIMTQLHHVWLRPLSVEGRGGVAALGLAEPLAHWAVFVAVVAAVAMMERELAQARRKRPRRGSTSPPSSSSATTSAHDPVAVLQRRLSTWMAAVGLLEQHHDDADVCWTDLIATNVWSSAVETGLLDVLRPSLACVFWAELFSRITALFPQVFHSGSSISTHLVLMCVEAAPRPGLGCGAAASSMGKQMALNAWRRCSSKATQQQQHHHHHHHHLRLLPARSSGGLTFSTHIARRRRSNFVGSRSSFTGARELRGDDAPGFLQSTTMIALPHVVGAAQSSSSSSCVPAWSQQWEEAYVSSLMELRASLLRIFSTYVHLPVFQRFLTPTSSTPATEVPRPAVVGPQTSMYVLLRLLHALAAIGEPTLVEDEVTGPHVALHTDGVTSLCHDVLRRKKDEDGAEKQSLPPMLRASTPLALAACVLEDVLPHCGASLVAQLRQVAVMSLSNSGPVGAVALMMSHHSHLRALPPGLGWQRLISSLLWSGLSAHKMKMKEVAVENNSHDEDVLCGFGTGSLAFGVLSDNRQHLLHLSSLPPQPSSSSSSSSSADLAPRVLRLVLRHLLDLAVATPDDGRAAISLIAFMSGIPSNDDAMHQTAEVVAQQEQQQHHDDDDVAKVVREDDVANDAVPDEAEESAWLAEWQAASELNEDADDVAEVEEEYCSTHHDVGVGDDGRTPLPAATFPTCGDDTTTPSPSGNDVDALDDPKLPPSMALAAIAAQHEMRLAHPASRHILHSLVGVLSWHVEPLCSPSLHTTHKTTTSSSSSTASLLASYALLCTAVEPFLRHTPPHTTAPLCSLRSYDVVEMIVLVLLHTCPDLFLLAIFMSEMLRIKSAQRTSTCACFLPISVEAQACQMLYHHGISAEKVRQWRRQRLPSVDHDDDVMKSVAAHCAVLQRLYAGCCSSAPHTTSVAHFARRHADIHDDLVLCIGSFVLLSLDQRHIAGRPHLASMHHHRNVFVEQFLHRHEGKTPQQQPSADEYLPARGVVLPSLQLVRSPGRMVPRSNVVSTVDAWNRLMDAPQQHHLRNALGSGLPPAYGDGFLLHAMELDEEEDVLEEVADFALSTPDEQRTTSRE